MVGPLARALLVDELGGLAEQSSRALDHAVGEGAEVASRAVMDHEALRLLPARTRTPVDRRPRGASGPPTWITSLSVSRNGSDGVVGLEEAWGVGRQTLDCPHAEAAEEIGLGHLQPPGTGSDQCGELAGRVVAECGVVPRHAGVVEQLVEQHLAVVSHEGVLDEIEDDALHSAPQDSVRVPVHRRRRGVG